MTKPEVWSIITTHVNIFPDGQCPGCKTPLVANVRHECTSPTQRKSRKRQGEKRKAVGDPQEEK